MGRRPALTPQQKQHQKEYQRLLALRKASARHCITMDSGDDSTITKDALEVAALSYANALPIRALRRLAK